MRACVLEWFGGGYQCSWGTEICGLAAWYMIWHAIHGVTFANEMTASQLLAMAEVETAPSDQVAGWCQQRNELVIEDENKGTGFDRVLAKMITSRLKMACWCVWDDGGGQGFCTTTTMQADVSMMYDSDATFLRSTRLCRTWLQFILPFITLQNHIYSLKRTFADIFQLANDVALTALNGFDIPLC